MKLTSKDVGDVKVVSVWGNLDTNTSPDAEEFFNDLVTAGAAKILLNLGDLNFISSAGLRVLLALSKQLRGGAGELRLCALNNNVKDVFEISGFSTILGIYEGEDEALDAF